MYIYMKIVGKIITESHGVAQRVLLGVSRFKIVGSFFIVGLFLIPDYAQAYIGPGAGFAFLGSGFIFVLTFLMAVATLLFWPLQWLWRKIRKRGISKKARARRVVIVGLDGLEPKLVDRFMAEDNLPNLKALSEQGCFSRLGTTLPALSPVAWSSFQTGVNPGAHNIFDFLTRDKRTCLPQLTSTKTVEKKPWFSLFGLSFPPIGAEIQITRKSQPFWKILGKHGIFSNVLRVPISYPPEKFFGNVLSAMCTPDLKGTQGSFTLVTTKSREDQSATGGQVQVVKAEADGSIAGVIEGPPLIKEEGYSKVCFKLVPVPSEGGAVLKISKEDIKLILNRFSNWVELEFDIGKRKRARGLVRFCLREIGPKTSLYISPVNIHPEHPALPIAHPIFFSRWLAKKLGLFGTLGLMEDTWGRNEHAIDDARFLEQTYLTHTEREGMFMEALNRTREGLCVCVFDASDRIQHMFWRYMEEDHPSPREQDVRFEKTIEEMYSEMDALVGRIQKKIRKDDVLIVMSDHGFTSFRRCVNINSWLKEAGYLVTKDGSSGSDYLQDVDWTKTKAFAIGLSGLYLNIKGREVRGIVDPSEVSQLKAEISQKLEELTDPQSGARAVRKVHDTAKAYRGLYASDAPDLILGYESGYRVSWDSITGTLEPEVFSDNLKAWSGDHHVDPELVPGVFFCNRKLKAENPRIVDLAPTALDLFGVSVPKYMEGQILV